MSTISDGLTNLIEALLSGDSSRVAELSAYQPELIVAALQRRGLNIDGDGNIVGKTIRTGDGNIVGSHNVMISVKTELPQLAEQLANLSATLESQAEELSHLKEAVSAIQSERQTLTYKVFLQALALGVFIFLISLSPYFQVFELKVFDRKVKASMADKPKEDNRRENQIIIIPLNDTFLEKNDKNEDIISRGKLASLITRLSAKKPKVIGIDVLLDKRQKGDENLVKVIETARNVIIPFDLTNDLTKVSLPLLEFEKAAASIGFGNFRKDPIDGIVREVPLEWKDGKTYYPFALEILRYGADKEIEKILEGHLEKTGYLRINFERKIDFESQDEPFIIKPEDLETENFTDKIVLIGYVGTQQPKDEFLTPLSVSDEKMKGVEIHAHILNTIVSVQYIRSWKIVDMMVILLFAFLGGYCSSKFKWITKLVILLTILVGYIIVILGLFVVRVDLPLWSPMITFTLTIFLKLT